MTTELPEEEFELLWDDGDLVCLRVGHHPDRSSTLLVQPAVAHPTAASLARLEHAYSLREELDASWAARPMELIDGRGKLALRTEDPGGHVLALATRPKSAVILEWRSRTREKSFIPVADFSLYFEWLTCRLRLNLHRTYTTLKASYSLPAAG